MRKILFLVVLLFTVFVQQSEAQNVPRSKAMLTLNLIRYLGWEAAAREGDFVIGVVKDRETFKWLQNLSEGRKMGAQNIVVKEFKSIEEVESCHVVYMGQGSNYAKNSDVIKGKLGKNTLIVTESEGATSKGSMINFVIRDNKLVFELSRKNATSAGIGLSQKVEKLAYCII